MGKNIIKMSPEGQLRPKNADLNTDELMSVRGAAFKEKYVLYYKDLCDAAGIDYSKFVEYSLKFPRKSIRVNTLKTTVAELKKRLQENWNLEPIPWCKEGFWIEHKGVLRANEETGEEELEKRRDVGNLLEHSMGHIYLQEASSMTPPIVLEPKPGETILDMAASPGSKATQIGMYMQNKGLFIANDYKADRMSPLSLNLQRCGVSNCIETLMQGHWFANLGETFDRILVDAPCSGTGTVRKSIKTLQLWNPTMIQRLSGTQKQLIIAAYKCLKPGGTMVYSTCSVEPEENEAVITHLLESEYAAGGGAKLLPINLNIKRSPAITEFKGQKYAPEVKNCLRIWPQDNDTDGFFVAKIKKM